MAPKDPQPSGTRLGSWKEIAAHLNRDARTVQRWEKTEGLPVHRHLHESQASVYAYTDELDAWQTSRRAKGVSPEAIAPALPSRPRGWAARTWARAGIALVVASALATSASRDISRVLPFHERDWVLLDAFENHTGEPLLDGALRNALERELSNSNFLYVAPRERVEDALLLMRKPPDTKMDVALAREICLRDGGIRALVTGLTEKLGTTYLLSAEVIDPVRNVPVAIHTEPALGQDQIWPAVRRLSNWVRESLGESMDRIERSNQQLERATTPSFHALQLFTEADNASKHNQWMVSAQLARQAVTEDPNFASAHLWLAWALSNLGDWGWKAEAQRAIDLSGSVSERERLFIEASYDILTEKQEQAVPVLEALIRMYPDHYFGYANLTIAYEGTGRILEARDVIARAADLRPNDYFTNARAAVLLMQYGLARGSYFAQRSRALAKLKPPGPPGVLDLQVAFSGFDELWLQDDAAGALTELERLAQIPTQEHWADFMSRRYMVLGRFQEAREWFKRDPFNDPVYRANRELELAFYAGDEEKTRENLTRLLQILDRPVSVRTALLFARFRISGWDRKFAGLMRLPEDMRAGLHGASSLQEGRLAEAISFFQQSADEALRRGRTSTTAAEGLSIALEQSGNLQKAAAALEQASPERLRDPIDIGLGWLWNQARLAELYRKLGRNQDARKIEDELRKLLAVADPEHPILRQLAKR